MKYRLPLLSGVALLSACTVPREAPEARAAAELAMTAAMREAPRAEPALPMPDPATRLQSEIEALSHMQLARWALPAGAAAGIVAADLLRGMTPRVNAISFYREARPTEHPGVCELEGYDVWMRVPNEAGLSYAQHLDPPLQPYQYQPTRRWKVVGSTVASQRRGPPDCAAARPYRNWFDAPSAAAVHRAANLVELAQQRPGRTRLICQQMRYDEARQDFGFPACADARALFRQLTPDLIRRIRPADCTIAPSPPGCIGIEYHDPAAPGSHSIYVATVPDDDRPDYVQITQAMLPPH